MDTVSASSPALHLARRRDLFSTQIVMTALKQSFLMLRPDVQWKNPVMFVVEIGAVLTLLYVLQAAFGTSSSTVSITYFIALDIWLFLTVLFANFATAVAEERGKAQAETLRKTRVATPAFRRRADRSIEKVSSNDLRNGDVVVVEAAQIFPATATSSRASRWSTNRRSPANPRRSSARPAATARASPAARPCCRTASSCAFRPVPANRSSTR